MKRHKWDHSIPDLNTKVVPASPANAKHLQEMDSASDAISLCPQKLNRYEQKRFWAGKTATAGESHLILVAIRKTTRVPVGYICATHGNGEKVVNGIYVKNKEREKGIASLLLPHLVVWHHNDPTTAYVPADNEAANHTFLSNDFEVVDAVRQELGGKQQLLNKYQHLGMSEYREHLRYAYDGCGNVIGPSASLID